MTTVPELVGYDLMDPALQQCPYGFYALARERAPLYRLPSTGFWLVTSFELCREVIRQPDLYASGVSPMALKPDGVPAEVIAEFGKGWLPLASCSTSDPPRHTRVRAFLEPLFTVRRVRAIRPLIERTIGELLDRLGPRREIEFVRAHGQRLAGRCLVINLAPALDRQSRLGLAVGRRYHLAAVRRNRARRLIRESFRLLQGGFREPQWLVVVARAALAGARLATVQAEMLAHLARAGVIEWPTS